MKVNNNKWLKALGLTSVMLVLPASPVLNAAPKAVGQQISEKREYRPLRAGSVNDENVSHLTRRHAELTLEARWQDSFATRPGGDVASFINVAGQPKAAHCGTGDAMARYYKANPKALQRHQQERIDAQKRLQKQERQLKNQKNARLKSDKQTNSQSASLAANPTYIIPVVFHVYGTNFNGYSVNDALIIDALQRTNEDFQGLTADFADVIPEFAGVKQTLSIEFRLAQIDPNGNPTTGIIYHPNQSGFGNGSGYDSLIQADAWDNYKYMNVYIQNDLYADGVTNNSGVAWYPDSWMSDNNLARVVYNGAYLGNNTDENFRSVLTHEFGHFLDLIHTFEGGCSNGNRNRCSTTGDKICDTPQADYSGLGSTPNCLGEITNWQNFMNYSSQYANFTQDQVNRMINALNMSSRNTLWSASNLAATGVDGGGGTTPPPSSGALENGVPVSGVSASTGQSANYFIDVPAGSSSLDVTIAGGSGDADLYLKFGSEPTDSSYDCRPYKSGNSESCSQTNPQAGRWYVRVKAYSTFSGVTLTASYSQAQPNQAPVAKVNGPYSGDVNTAISFSSAGSADADGSIASYQWDFGDGTSSSAANPSHSYASAGTFNVTLTVTDDQGATDSQTTTATINEVTQPPSGNDVLQNGVAVSVSGASGSESFYQIDLPADASNLTFEISGGSGDADLYVKFGSQPTTNSYDCRPYKSGNNETCNITNIQAGTYYVMLRGYSSFNNVSLVATYTTGGSNPPPSGGLVDACASQSPISGYALDLNSDNCVASTNNTNSISYFYFYVPSSGTNVTIESGYGSGDASLYYSSSSWATSSSFEQSSTNSGNSESLTLNNLSSGYHYVSLVGQYSGVTLSLHSQ